MEKSSRRFGSAPAPAPSGELTHPAASANVMPMNEVLRSVVLVVLAPDRPGLIERLSGAVVAAGGNWLGSHFASLGGYFGGIAHVTVPVTRLPELASAVDALRKEGLQILWSEGAPQAPVAPPTFLNLRVVGQDRPGIVNRISQTLARRQVNIQELETRYSTAPMAGHELFEARMRLEVPAGLDLDELRRELEGIANDLMVDLSLD
ncbi:MAG: glycine cleavage system protein R [Acidobacteriota bacterium]